MRAVVLTGHGGLDKLEHHENWPVPVPAPGEVLVRVGACGLNNTDINTRAAWYSKSVTEGITDTGGKHGFDSADAGSGSWGGSRIGFPRIQRADVAGRSGARLLLAPWLLASGDWLDASRSMCLGSECDGGYAEYTKIRSENALAFDSELSDAELATFPCACSTAENLTARSGLRPGETVVVNGATIGPPGTMQRLAKLIERGRLRPLLARAFPLADLHRAQQTFLQKKHTGNIAVEPR